MKRLVLLILSFCASCAPLGGGEAAKTIRIGVTPLASPASGALIGCAVNLLGDPAIRIHGVNVKDLNYDDFDFVVQLGQPALEDAFAAPLASERIVLIVNPANATGNLTQSQARQLLLGQVREWNELGGPSGAVELWVGFEGDEARRTVEDSLLAGASVSGAAKLATPDELLKQVSDDDGALGILPAALVNDAAKPIDLGLELPLLAVAAEEPTGDARVILACLQTTRGQKLLSENYSVDIH